MALNCLHCLVKMLLTFVSVTRQFCCPFCFIFVKDVSGLNAIWLKHIIFPFDSLIGASLCISVSVYPHRHVMPSSGGKAVSQWCLLSADGSFDLRSSTSGGSSVACVALQQDASQEFSENVNSPWAASTRCLHLSGSISVKWCVGPSAIRWDLNVSICSFLLIKEIVTKWISL